MTKKLSALNLDQDPHLFIEGVEGSLFESDDDRRMAGWENIYTDKSNSIAT